MRHSISFGASFSAAILLAWLTFAGSVGSYAQTLPLSVTVNMSEFPNLDDNDLGEEGLVNLSTLFIVDYVSSGLEEQVPQRWRLDSDAENELLISLSQRGEGGEVKIQFSFSEAGFPVLSYHGREVLGFPSYSTFVERLRREIEVGMFEKWPEIDESLSEIHAMWGTGEQTEIAIDHRLDPEHSRTFSSTRARLVLGEQSALSLVRDSIGGAYQHMVATSPNYSVRGAVRPMRLDGYRSHESFVGHFCMKRQPNAIATDNIPSVGYTCPVSGLCESGGVAPSGWALSECDSDHGFVFDLRNSFANGMPGFVSRAFASEPAPEHWSVPSLDILHERLVDDSSTLTGFTDFSISTTRPLNLAKPADEVSLELSSNGMPIWLDGVPPSDNRMPLRPLRGLSLRFGLQNLQFGSLHNGCEALDARLVFYKDDQPTGEDVILRRQYAALRHPAARTFLTDIGELNWQGHYYQPAHTGESGLFLSGGRFSREDPQERDELLEYLESLRLQLEDANLTIDARDLGGTLGLPIILADGEGLDDQPLSIVGKIRPPRTRFPDGRYAYGLQVAVQQPNGLVQFTFDRDQIAALKDSLILARSEFVGLQSFIPSRSEDFFVYRYTEERNIGPEWVCEGP